MSLYEDWIKMAYQSDGTYNAKVWNDYLVKEQKIYEDILENKIEKISGTLLELAQRYDLSSHYMMGFIDGINEALPELIEVEALQETTPIEININFEKLYKKMVEYKAEHLYNLPQWDAIYSLEEQDCLYKEEKRSRTVVKDPKIGRNDPCPCGSGMKYKKCCGA